MKDRDISPLLDDLRRLARRMTLDTMGLVNETFVKLLGHRGSVKPETKIPALRAALARLEELDSRASRVARGLPLHRRPELVLRQAVARR